MAPETELQGSALKKTLVMEKSLPVLSLVDQTIAPL